WTTRARRTDPARTGTITTPARSTNSWRDTDAQGCRPTIHHSTAHSVRRHPGRMGREGQAAVQRRRRLVPRDGGEGAGKGQYSRQEQPGRILRHLLDHRHLPGQGARQSCLDRVPHAGTRTIGHVMEPERLILAHPPWRTNWLVVASLALIALFWTTVIYFVALQVHALH